MNTNAMAEGRTEERSSRRFGTDVRGHIESVLDAEADSLGQLVPLDLDINDEPRIT